jgi:hypothetical protein
VRHQRQPGPNLPSFGTPEGTTGAAATLVCCGASVGAGQLPFVKTFKRDYAQLSILPDAETVIALLPAWFEDYNEVHRTQA